MTRTTAPSRPLARDTPRGTFGPQRDHIIAFVERCTRLTGADRASLLIYEATASITRGREWQARGNALRALSATTLPDRYAAGTAAAAAAPPAKSAAVQAVSDVVIQRVALALTARHLIGQGTFTATDYDVLTLPWRATLGPVHPRDRDVKGCSL